MADFIAILRVRILTYEQIRTTLETPASRRARHVPADLRGNQGDSRLPDYHSFLTYKKEAAQYGYQVGKISMKEKHITFQKMEGTV